MILENPIYMELVLCIARGIDYSTAIAKELGKRQSTVTEQLQVLENEGLIVARKGREKKYGILFDKFVKEFYETAESLVPPCLELEGIIGEDVLPQSLIMFFLKVGSKVVEDVNVNLVNLIIRFFLAVGNLSEENLNRFIKRFGIRDVDFFHIWLEVIKFQSYGIETLTILRLLREENEGSFER